jgi:DNA-directed RNA polymerase specialized sigma24 family protein
MSTPADAERDLAALTDQLRRELARARAAESAALKAGAGGRADPDAVRRADAEAAEARRRADKLYGQAVEGIRRCVDLAREPHLDTARRAYAGLFDYLYPDLLACALAVARGNRRMAEEAVVDAFRKGWEQLGKFHTGTDLKRWLMGIARNLIADEGRRNRKYRPLDDGRAAGQALARTRVASPLEEASDKPLPYEDAGSDGRVSREELQGLLRQLLGGLTDIAPAVTALQTVLTERVGGPEKGPDRRQGGRPPAHLVPLRNVTALNGAMGAAMASLQDLIKGLDDEAARRDRGTQ